MIKTENWNNDCDFYGWQPECYINNSSITNYITLVEWLYDNVHNTESNVCWTYANCPVLRFRKAKDQVWFLLRWS